MDDFYLTIAHPAKAETKVKGSRFIAETKIVESENEVSEFLRAVRKREHAATHHCYAYRIGHGNNVTFKYSDDGEPSGTAGKPIYDCITGRNLTNVVAVVIRYFGGTKLGTGGLVRSYSQTAVGALEKSGEKTIYITDRLQLRFDFKYYDQVLKMLEKHQAEQISSEFSEVVKLSVLVRQSKTDELKNEITNLTHGQAQIE